MSIVSRGWCCIFYGLIVAWMMVGYSLAIAQASTKVVIRQPVVNRDVDSALHDIYQAIAHQQIDEALRRTDQLIAAYPNFRLAYLIRGDLLLAHVKPIKTMGNADAKFSASLQDLREEALVRLQAKRAQPPPNLVPRYLLQLRPDQKTAVVVDSKRSRLYVYENINGRPRFLADYYISQGKQGVSKSREGDQKTPIGIYQITANLPKAQLSDFYGAGALPLDYPNEWDRMNGRTGHGIWLHGTPSNTYSRPPKASDGCVVLTNQDWLALFQNVKVGTTPVIISDKVEWLSFDDWEAERRMLQKSIESWRKDWEERNINRYLLNYSNRFVSDTENFAQWSKRKRQIDANKTWVKVALNNISMLRYPGKDDMVVVTFDQDYRSNNLSSQGKKRQYWVREKNRWKILYEGAV